MIAAARARLLCLAWSRVFSPLVPELWRKEAWEALGLPGAWPEVEAAFWSTFHVGLPGPRVPLLVHAAIGCDGGRAREDALRVAAHLGLALGEHTLPPDHLAIVCELLACAIEAEEDVLVRELCARYALPWCAAAQKRLAADTSALGTLPGRFAADLRALVEAVVAGDAARAPAAGGEPLRSTP